MKSSPPSTIALAALMALTVASLAPTRAEAQAWIHDPGEGYAELTFRTMSSDRFYDATGDIRDIRSRYSQHTVQVYGELGIVPRWLQLVVDGEVFRRNALADQGATTGLGDTGVGLWTGLWQDDVKVAAGLRAGLPTGDPEPTAPGDDPQADIIAASLPTGDGVFDLTPKLAVGYSPDANASALRTYVTGTTGYQVRVGPEPNAFQWRLEAGLKIPVAVLERFWFAGRLRGLHPLGDASRSSFSGLGHSAAYISPGLSISAEIYRGFGIRSNIEGAFYARNILAGLPVQFGLYYDF